MSPRNSAAAGSSSEAARSSAPRSASGDVRVFCMCATMSSSEAPTAPASAEADPPPGVGSVDANASRISETVLLTSMHDLSGFDDGTNGRRADPNEIDRYAVHEDSVHLLAGFERTQGVGAVN